MHDKYLSSALVSLAESWYIAGQMVVCAKK